MKCAGRRCRQARGLPGVHAPHPHHGLVADDRIAEVIEVAWQSDHPGPLLKELGDGVQEKPAKLRPRHDTRHRFGNTSRYTINVSGTLFTVVIRFRDGDHVLRGLRLQ